MKTLLQIYRGPFRYDITFFLAVIAGIMSVAYLRFAYAYADSGLDWVRIQEREQALATKTSEIRYLCVNDMAFDLNHDDRKIVPGEDILIIANEETKRRCQLPWMPHFDKVSTAMSAVSPANGYGALFVTLGSGPKHVTTRLNQAGWRESETSKRWHPSQSGYQGHLYKQKSAWILVIIKKARDSNETTALLAGQWEPKMMATQ